MRRRIVPLTLAAAVALGACAADPDEVTIDDELDAEAVPTEGAGEPDPEVTPEDGGTSALPGGPPSPAPGGDCVELSPTEEGLWTVADAGIVSLTVEEGGLLFADVQPAGGWDYEVVQEDGPEVQVEFRREDQGLDLSMQWQEADENVTAELCPTEGEL